MRHYFHAGDLGDIIYALPVVRAMGGGVLHLMDDRGLSMHGMTRERFDAIAPLLRVQPYVQDVRPDAIPRPTDPATIPVVDLNRFRFSGQDFVQTFLADTHLNTWGLPLAERSTAWLHVARPRRVRPVVLARSIRYHNHAFPWRRVLDQYGPHAMFVGTPAEHAAFVSTFGDVEYVHTPTLLGAAQVIAAASLFIGNQSCPLAIAHGLKKPAVVEVCLACPNCIDPRPDCWPGRDGLAYLPPLENLDAVPV